MEVAIIKKIYLIPLFVTFTFNLYSADEYSIFKKYGAKQLSSESKIVSSSKKNEVSIAQLPTALTKEESLLSSPALAEPTNKKSTGSIARNNRKFPGNHYASSLYKKLSLEETISFPAFERAVRGYNNIFNKSKNILTIADFSKNSGEKRFLVLDMSKEKVLYSTYVTHGKNSGLLTADEFSNEIDSNKSSPGFYLTKSTYFGQNGFSLKIDGLEKGINDKAMERYIVVHGSNYATPTSGRVGIGRSLGCPAIPSELAKPVINSIKDGSVFYIHTENENYLRNSNFLPS